METGPTGWTGGQPELLRQLRTDSERTKEAFKSFLMIGSNDERGFLKFSTIWAYKVGREDKGLAECINCQFQKLPF